MVCSEVQIVYRKGILNIFEALEQAALVALSAASIAGGNVFLCNGAGYLVTKKGFENLKLPDAWNKSPGGDDVMLLHAMYKAGKKISYCRLPQSAVMTEPATFTEFIGQRIRWGSKVFIGNASGNFLPALFTWLFHVLNVCLLGISISFNGLWIILIASLLTRGIGEALLVMDFLSPDLKKTPFHRNEKKNPIQLLPGCRKQQSA